MGAAAIANGQGTFLSTGPISILTTGEETPLVTESRSVQFDADGAPAYLRFRFGFDTAETPAPGSIHDSFSVSLQSSDHTLGVVYLTADVWGPAWAPNTPGAVALDPETIDRREIEFPDSQTVLGSRQSYEVQAPLPKEMAGMPLFIYFDLFDNQNSESSLAWFSDVVVIPEPRPTLLIASFFMLWMAWRVRRVERKPNVIRILHGRTKNTRRAEP